MRGADARPAAILKIRGKKIVFDAIKALIDEPVKKKGKIGFVTSENDQ